MTPSTLFIFAFFIVKLVNAQSPVCAGYLKLHDIVSQDSHVMTIDDEAGLRSIKATRYAIGGCGDSPNFPTGKHFAGNYSLLGAKSELGSGNCVTKKILGQDVMESVIAIVIQTNGWFLEITGLDIDDIDSQTGVPLHEAWMEAAAAFGMAEGKVVLPSTTLPSGTLLSKKQYLVPKSTLNAMGITLDETSVPGAEYSADEVFNCPFGREHADSAKCRMTISFDSPVDTVVLLYGLKQQSLTAVETASFVSQLDLKCGCRCVHGSVGSREIALPTDKEGLCTRIVTTANRTECDVLGQWWCTMENGFAYKIVGEESRGEYPCVREAAFASRVLRKFEPMENFEPVA